MEDILIEVEKKLKKYGQEHLLNGYSKLDEVKEIDRTNTKYRF